jgi:hypothetical protein
MDAVDEPESEYTYPIPQWQALPRSGMIRLTEAKKTFFKEVPGVIFFLFDCLSKFAIFNHSGWPKNGSHWPVQRHIGCFFSSISLISLAA